jgi:hypothetical protein
MKWPMNINYMTWLTEIKKNSSGDQERRKAVARNKKLVIANRAVRSRQKLNPTSQVKRTTLYWTVEWSMRSVTDSSIERNRQLRQSEREWPAGDSISPWDSNRRSNGSEGDEEIRSRVISIQQIERWSTRRAYTTTSIDYKRRSLLSRRQRIP